MGAGENRFPGYREYQRREFCRVVRCPLQLELEKEDPGSAAYEAVREKCRRGCVHTTYEFHHWLIERGFVIIRPAD